jgi:hypothetical protein
MPYYPLSQIKTNLHTNGNEFTLNSNNPDPTLSYSGYYWKTSDGNYYTGRTPQDLPTQQLYPIQSIDTTKYPNVQNSPALSYITSTNVDGSDINALTYNNIKNINPNQVTIVPTYSPTYPTTQDYQAGEFRRFFCKKTNEIQYVEISIDQYNLLTKKDSQILWQLYFPFNIPWVITGTAESAARTNKNVVELTMKQLTLPRFDDYLKKDYLKYFI